MTESKNPACGSFCLINLACGAFIDIKNLACGACLAWKYFFLIILGIPEWSNASQGCIWFEISYSVYQFIGGENVSREAFKRSGSVDTIWVTQRDCDSGEQTTWIKQSVPQRYVCVGCQLNSDQALRSHCLKEHVRARDSTLWQYRWQEASEFLCTKIPLLEGVEHQKHRPKTTEMLFLTRC